MFAQSCQQSRQCPSRTVGRPVDGNIKVGLGILDQQVGSPGNRHLDTAALVFPAARTIDIGKTDRNLAHVLTGPIKREMDAPLDVLAQTGGEIETCGLDDDVHGGTPGGLATGKTVAHGNQSNKSNIIDQQIDILDVFIDMAALNYKHLRYFWVVAKSGAIARAGEQLHLTPQSISGQIRELEEALGVALFRRVGRGLELTDSGRRILGYAEEIFALGDELLDAVRDQTATKSLPFAVGIADSVPKSVAHRLVEPALHLPEPVRLICREGRLTALLAELAIHRLDMVIADRPMPANLNVRGYNHLLGESTLTVFGAAALVETLRPSDSFPAMLDGAPFLMPGEDVAIRPRLEHWFEAQRLHPRIIGEFDDSALLKAFGQAGDGLFVAPTAIAAYVCEQYRVTSLGRIDSIAEQLFAITTERRLTHPAIVAISQVARNEVFGDAARSPRADDGAHHREPTVAARNGHAAGPARPRRKPLP
jgi:LysR family transcriptional activator of nhaA